MSSEEERLYARAEMLEDLAEPARADHCGPRGRAGRRCRPAGRHQPDRCPADPRPRRRHCLQRGRQERPAGRLRVRLGRQFLEALSDAEDQVRETYAR